MSFLVVGTGLNGLDENARTAIRAVDRVFGPSRASGWLTDVPYTPWPKRFTDVFAELDELNERDVTVGIVATGDPMWFGIGSTLTRRYGADAVKIVPSPSAFSLAAARMKWPLEHIACVSLHGTATNGRSVAALSQHVAPNTKIIALSAGQTTPGEIAHWLTERGFGQSTMTVLERMGTNDERIRSMQVSDFDLNGIADMNVVAIECDVASGASWHAMTGGLPNDAFTHDGQLTKADIRAMTIARLRPRAGGVMWDVGAGCGSVGIEWLRLSPNGTVHAVEPKRERADMIATNRKAFGLSGLEIIEARAPDALDSLPAPDVVFIGGGIIDPAITQTCWSALRSGGTIAANVVTLEGEARLAQLHKQHGGRLTRVSISHAEKIGPYRGWRPAMPVLMWSAEKRA